MEDVMFDNQIFELSEATKILPLISSIMRDVLTSHGELEQLIEEYERTRMPKAMSVILDDDINTAIHKLQLYIEEAEKYGGMVRDTKLGTVDFAGVVGGRLVWFCWNLGESQVEHYHGIRESCSCRKSIVEIPQTTSI